MKLFAAYVVADSPTPSYLTHQVGDITKIFNFVVTFGPVGILSLAGLKLYFVMIRPKSLALRFMASPLAPRALPGKLLAFGNCVWVNEQAVLGWGPWREFCC